eukprot:6011787-Amphidinium_carterae.1
MSATGTGATLRVIALKGLEMQGIDTRSGVLGILQLLAAATKQTSQTLTIVAMRLASTPLITLADMSLVQSTGTLGIVRGCIIMIIALIDTAQLCTPVHGADVTRKPSALPAFKRQGIATQLAHKEYSNCLQSP